MPRAFIAFPIPPSTQPALDKASQGLQQQLDESAQWASPHNRHLTLAFLGEVPLNSLRQLAVALEQALSDMQPIQLTLDSAGGFPANQDQTRVMAAMGQSTPALTAINNTIQMVLKQNRLPVSQKPFLAHITLARFKRAIHKSQYNTVRLNETVNFNEVVIYQSNTTDQGVGYKPLYQTKLKNIE